jgi:Fic family protein
VIKALITSFFDANQYIITSSSKVIMRPKHLTTWIWQQSDWPKFTWDSAALAAPLATARRVQGEVAGMAKLLDPSLDLNAQLEVLTAEGVATSAIEGEKFDPGALRSSLARRLGLPTAGLPSPPRSIEGLVDVLLDATRQYDEPLTLARLCSWQAALLPTGRSGLHEIRVGMLRGEDPMQIVSGPIGREKVHYQAPPHTRLTRDIEQFLAWFNAPPTGLDGLLRAGVAHAWFELIHPFDDGNGRVGRALLDRALAQDEQRAVRLYSMSARMMAVRDEYYEALAELSRGDLDVTAWLRWFLAQITIAGRDSEQIIHHVLRKARFWFRHSQQPLNDRQRKTLNAMLDAGPRGHVGGMTNRKYANLTKSSAATAQRDLAELVAIGCLVTAGAGRSARYELSGTDP